MDKKQLRRGRFTADLYVNRKFDPPVFHYIITEDGSSDILDWGQERSWDDCEREAEKSLADYEARRAG